MVNVYAFVLGYHLKSQVVPQVATTHIKLLLEDIKWDNLNDLPEHNDMIDEKAIYIHNRCFHIGNGQILVQDYGSRHYNNRYGVVHSYNISSSEFVLLLDIKQGEEREMVRG